VLEENIILTLFWVGFLIWGALEIYGMTWRERQALFIFGVLYAGMLYLIVHFGISLPG
jgi:hypothetical protein